MRSLLIALLVATVVVAGAAWYASRSPGDVEVQRAGRATDPVPADSVLAQPGPESRSSAEVRASDSGEMVPPGTTREDRPELVTPDPPPPTASGPTLEAVDPSPDVAVRDELVTVPVDADPAPAGRPELETVPADAPDSARRDELADAPVPGQGNTSTR